MTQKYERNPDNTYSAWVKGSFGDHGEDVSETVVRGRLELVTAQISALVRYRDMPKKDVHMLVQLVEGYSHQFKNRDVEWYEIVDKALSLLRADKAEMERALEE